MPPRSRKLAALPPLFLLALACLCLAALAPLPRPTAAQDNSTPAKEEPKADVYGRAVYAGTGRPVRRARVGLVGSGGGRTDLGALTNAQGEFRIRGVRAGRYYAVVDVPGAMSPIPFISYEQSGVALFPPGEVDKYFELIETDGKSDREVTVRVRPGGAIAGKVIYTGGDPAAGVRVHVMRRAGGLLAQMSSGTGDYLGLSGAGARTDDRGAYRVAGLPPGDYVVAVSEAENHGDDNPRSGGYGGEAFESVLAGKLLTTYYPSATSAKEATTVSLGAGDERDDVDVTVAERETHTVSGVVRGRGSNRPILNARVSLAAKDDSGADVYAFYYSMQANQTRTDEQGRWQLKDIPDGRYTISVRPPEDYEPGGAADAANHNASVITNANVTISTGPEAPPRRRKRYSPAQRDVQVSGGDVTELAFELSEGGRVSGTVTVEGDGPQPEYIHVSLLRAGRSLAELEGEEPPSATASGGAFDLEGVPPGRFLLRVDSWGRKKEEAPYLKAVTWNGHDLMREPLEVGEGASVEGVRVVYSSDAAMLGARAVYGEGKKPAVEVGFFLLPTDPSQWSFLASQYFCATGEDGKCTINAAPGDYLVVYMRRISVADIEAEIRKRAAAAPRVSLRAGETKVFEAVVTEEN